MIQTIEIHEKTSKTKFKTIFGSRNLLFGPFMRYQFYIGKTGISAIPGRTQTRISWARIWILTFHKKRWLRIKKLFHMKLNMYFYPYTPPIIRHPRVMTLQFWATNVIFWCDFRPIFFAKTDKNGQFWWVMNR